MKVNWYGFLEKARQDYPNEACAFLFSKKPYSPDEEWFVFGVKNVSLNPQESWEPDKKETQQVKKLATDMGLVKIGNVHTHPYLEDLDKDLENFEIAKRPSDTDLKYARKFNDIVRIILLCDKEKIYSYFVHDKFGNEINIKIEDKNESL